MNTKNFDLIFSIGEACSCTSVLRLNNLQFCSYPLDWLFGTDFEGRIEILTNEFHKFLEKEDLEFSYEERSISCSAYANKRNDIVFNHDFLKDLDFNEAYNLVKAKYDRRIKRLLENIEKANSILVVYLETPVCNHKIEDDKKIVAAFNKLLSKYPDKTIKLYYLQNKEGKGFSKENLNENITKFTLDYKEPSVEFDYLVDCKKLKKIFAKLHLNHSRHIILKRKINKLWINLLPIKSLRTKLRKRYHV